MMLLRALLAVLVVGLISAGVSADARPAAVIPRCQSVSVAGGDDNGLTGGVIVAHLFVKNIGTRACAVIGRPWIRIPRLSHAVTLTDISSGPAAGTPSGRVILSSGALASAEILLNPGRCDRGRSVTFALLANAGWQKRSVRIEGDICNDGSGEIAVATFRPA
jgi:hypothetical protein